MKRLLLTLVLLTCLLGLLGLCLGATGWTWPWAAGSDPVILWELRLPRTLGAWLAGALLGLTGAIAQGVFRNPLADPYLLGSASGAALGVAAVLAAGGSAGAEAMAAGSWLLRLGLTGAAFLGAVGAVFFTLVLAQGLAHTLRLLLAGVIIGVVLGAMTSLLGLAVPAIAPALQAFMVGSTGLLGWTSVGLLGSVLMLGLVVAALLGPWLDALALGEETAASLGLPLGVMRGGLIAVLALGTGTVVAQAGLIAFVGLAAPHAVRATKRLTHRPLLLASALMGGVLLLAADLLSRWVLAPQELPVGILTACLGGGYLLWWMQRQSRAHGGEAA
ncbi:MAG: iron ABC transporter permease [Candidatus Sericytochromatia bacterium]|nr:iron ABC transporter permease [Candidatus Sericytochromatia bacterium]